MGCLEEVLNCLLAAGLRLKPKKCKLLQAKVAYLGHVVSGEGIATDPQKVQAVEELREPKDLHDV